jgi:hypothetical protein
MILVVRIKLVLNEMPYRVLKEVQVALFDRDLSDQDDHLGSGLTGDNGEARIVFDSDRYTDREDQPAWRVDSLPDLYVIVYNNQGEAVFSTRRQVVADDLPDVITVAVPKSVAQQHALIT